MMPLTEVVEREPSDAPEGTAWVAVSMTLFKALVQRAHPKLVVIDWGDPIEPPRGPYYNPTVREKS
jgi:hypothetical protein